METWGPCGSVPCSPHPLCCGGTAGPGCSLESEEPLNQHSAEGSTAESKPSPRILKNYQIVPFFFEQVEGKSLSSTFTEGLLHFILQKKERRAPEHNRDGPGVISVLTGSPAANQHTKCDELRVVLSVRRGNVTLNNLFLYCLPVRQE